MLKYATQFSILELNECTRVLLYYSVMSQLLYMRYIYKAVPLVHVEIYYIFQTLVSWMDAILAENNRLYMSRTSHNSQLTWKPGGSVLQLKHTAQCEWNWHQNLTVENAEAIAQKRITGWMHNNTTIGWL